VSNFNIQDEASANVDFENDSMLWSRDLDIGKWTTDGRYLTLNNNTASSNDYTKVFSLREEDLTYSDEKDLIRKK
jgi:hypothetical protein